MNDLKNRWFQERYTSFSMCQTVAAKTCTRVPVHPAHPWPVLSRNFVTGGCTVIDRWLRTLALGIGIGEKLGDFKMAVSLEPFDRFWCFNFWLKAFDVYFYPGLTTGQSDPHNRRSTTAAASCGQHCMTCPYFCQKWIKFSIIPGVVYSG